MHVTKQASLGEWMGMGEIYFSPPNLLHELQKREMLLDIKMKWEKDGMGYLKRDDVVR